MMRLRLWAKFVIGYTVMTLFSAGAFAQVSPVNPDVLLANPAADDDFLLPSYWTTSPTASAAPETTQAPTDVDILTAIFGAPGSGQTPTELNKGDGPWDDHTAQLTKKTFYPRSMVDREDQEAEDGEDQGPLLTPLPELPPAPEPEIPPRKLSVAQSGYVNQLLHQTLKPQDGATVPKEIRIKFYPNDAQLSSQNLRWIKLFTGHVLSDPRLVLIIRLSNQNWTLQRSRLALILHVVMEAGLTAHQIRVYSSNRDENTIILSYAHNDTLTQIQPFQERAQPIKEQKTLSW